MKEAGTGRKEIWEVSFEQKRHRTKKKPFKLQSSRQRTSTFLLTRNQQNCFILFYLFFVFLLIGIGSISIKGRFVVYSDRRNRVLRKVFAQ